MIVIKRLWASVFHNIIVEEILEKQISFVIFLLKSTQKVIYVYTTQTSGQPKSTEPWDYGETFSMKLDIFIQF